MQSRLLIPRSLLGLSASLLALACAGPPDAAPFVERIAIVNGEPSDAMDDEVVDIYSKISDADTLHCSGTLIAPDVVLTALHCVSYREDPNATFTCNADGSIAPSVPGAGSLGAPVPGENVQVFLGATHGSEPDALGLQVFGSGATQICRGDIAVVVLNQEIGSEFAAVRLGRGVSIGETVTIVGYGQTEETVSEGRHRRTGRRVLDVGISSCGPGSSTTPPETFVLGEGPCHGDSGGPAFSDETGAVTGVYSLSLAPSCLSIGIRNTFTVVPTFEPLIREAMEFAGREPVIESSAGGSSGAPGCAATSGTSGTSGTGGGTDEGEGSGSREDPSCTCTSTGQRRGLAYAWLGMAFAMFTVARRRNGARARVLTFSAEQ